MANVVQHQLACVEIRLFLFLAQLFSLPLNYLSFPPLVSLRTLLLHAFCLHALIFLTICSSGLAINCFLSRLPAVPIFAPFPCPTVRELRSDVQGALRCSCEHSQMRFFISALLQ